MEINVKAILWKGIGESSTKTMAYSRFRRYNLNELMDF